MEELDEETIETTDESQDVEENETAEDQVSTSTVGGGKTIQPGSSTEQSEANE